MGEKIVAFIEPSSNGAGGSRPWFTFPAAHSQRLNHRKQGIADGPRVGFTLGWAIDGHHEDFMSHISLCADSATRGGSPLAVVASFEPNVFAIWGLEPATRFAPLTDDERREACEWCASS